MVRGGDGEPEAGQSFGLRDILGFSGDWEVAVIVRVNAEFKTTPGPGQEGN
jgi:hypothetical protein